MARNASGNYSLPAVYRATPGTTIRSDQHNTPLEDIAAALTDSLPRNGSAPMTGNLSMGGRRIIGMGEPTEPGDAATRGYADGIRTTPARTDMDRGVLGRSATGTGAATTLTLGNGLEFNGTGIRARIGTGLSFVSGVITAAVARIATEDEALAGTNNEAAMTALRVKQFADANVLGLGQTWQRVTGSRTWGTIYRNTTGRPIMVNISGDAAGDDRYFQVSVDQSDWINVGVFGEASSMRASISAVVPVNWYYRVQSAVDFNTWAELR